MTMGREMLRLRVPFLGLAMFVGLTASIVLGRFCSLTLARELTPSSSLQPVATECEGDACSQVAVTIDESKQQYRAVNNSADRWARVTASNMAASASVCLAPGEDAYLPLKSISGAYHAAYAEAKCGEQAASGPPSGE
jgi:hypothetical protein